VTFSNQSGTTFNSVVSTDITFDTEACLTASTITLTVTDSLGCTESTILNVPNPCDSLSLAAITFTAPYTFTTTATSDDCNAVSFSWEYDNLIFNQVDETSSNFNSSLTLTPSGNVSTYPASTIIRVTSTDCRGCTDTQTYTFSFCTPITVHDTVDLFCTNDQREFQSAVVQIPTPIGCTGSTIDWNSL
jgi:hypothetical protein